MNKKNAPRELIEAGQSALSELARLASITGRGEKTFQVYWKLAKALDTVQPDDLMPWRSPKFFEQPEIKW